MCGNQRLVGRPRPEGLESHRSNQPFAIHADIAGSGRNRPGFVSQTSAQEVRRITTDPIDHLTNLVEGDRSGTARMKQPVNVSFEEPLQHPIEIIGVRRRADFIEIKRCGSAMPKPRVDPVDRPRVPAEARPHRQ